MPDDESKVGETDQSRVAADEDHGVSHLAETPAEAHKPIEPHDRDKIYAAAEALKLGWIA